MCKILEQKLEEKSETTIKLTHQNSENDGWSSISDRAHGKTLLRVRNDPRSAGESTKQVKNEGLMGDCFICQTLLLEIP